MSMHSGRCAARAAAGVVTALALAACGAAPQEPAAEAPAAPAMQAGYEQPQGFGAQPGQAQYPQAPSSQAMPRDDAAGELAQAEAELYAALGGSGFAQPPPKPGATTAPAPTVPQRPAGTQPATRPHKAGEVEATAKPPGDPCATACRALASMNRAADHLCGLAGESDARCNDARTRVRSASDRVQSQCPACAP